MNTLNSESHELLRKARQGTPPMPPEVRGRLRGAVMAGAGVSTVAAGVSFAKVIVVGVVSASLGSVATLVVKKRVEREEPTVSRPLADVAVTAAIQPVVVPIEAPVVEPEPVLARAEVTPPQRKVRVQTLPRPEPVVEPVVDERSLAAELETLEGILRATDNGNWADARVRLGAYRARFENGQLRVEAGALEVLTLCGEQHVQAARALRRELLAAEPLNPAVVRLATSCAGE
ncbi:MAG: hypothetical protein JNM69_37860 [Archangium sp.]|nr:hypothetical protein [Archangium sp.]